MYALTFEQIKQFDPLILICETVKPLCNLIFSLDDSKHSMSNLVLIRVILVQIPAIFKSMTIGAHLIQWVLSYFY